MKKILAFFGLCALAGLIPCVESPQVQAQYYYQTRTMPYAHDSYQGSYQSNYQNNYRRRVQFRNIRDDVLQINPAFDQVYNSAYSPGAYDGTVQADLVRQLAELKAQYAALLAAQKTPSPSPIVVVPSSTPGQQPVVVVQQPQQTAQQPLVQPQHPLAVPPVKLGPNGERPGILVLQAKCAVCHKQGSLSAGQQFIMLDAQGLLTKDAQTPPREKEILKRTYLQTMPPPNNIFGIQPVTDAEYALIVDALP